MENQLLKSLLAAQVLLLAKTIKAEKASKGTQTTSDCINDAINLIKQNQENIHASFVETPPH